jgi:3-phenylpropionate/cinnamic acid dioxygenase small subunit
MARLSRSEAEDLLYTEARLLDSRRYADWMKMLAEDVTYWVPSNGEGIDPRREVSLVYDNSRTLQDRIERLGSGVAHAQSPPSKTNRVVSNVQVQESADDNAKLLSVILLYELRRGKERIFAGRCEYRVRFENGSWKIVSKKVVLANNDEVIDNLTFIV